MERLKKRLVEAEGRVGTLTDEARDARERLATYDSKVGHPRSAYGVSLYQRCATTSRRRS